MEKPLLGMHYAANLERARKKWRQELPSSTSKAQLTLRWWWWPPPS